MMESWGVADCEIARASYMLSVAMLHQDSGSPDALVWREKAEALRRGMHGDAYVPDAHGEAVYNRMVESWVR